MATYQKRGTRRSRWQATIRRRGYGTHVKTFDTKVAAEAWARSLEAEMDAGSFVSRKEAEGTTLLEALERYEREVTPQKKGARRERGRIALWKRDPLALRFLASIRGVDIAKWRDTRRQAETSANTIRLDLALISHLFTVARREWGMESLTNPVRKIALPQAGRPRERRLAPDEEVGLLKACDTSSCSWLGPLVRLALATAMRMGELLALNWRHIDIDRGIARLLDTKNGESRNVPLSRAAIHVLEGMPRAIDGHVFPITQDKVEREFRKVLAVAGIEDFRFHDLRHEATSQLFEKGLNPMEVATITGHKTLQMLKRYTHLRAEDLAKKLQA
jgi:integrase